MTELKPCPVCGGIAEIYIGEKDLWKVGCADCRIFATDKKKDEAIRLWNEVNSKEVKADSVLRPCPFCGSQNLTKYRYNIGGFLNKAGCTETICDNGEMFRIECDCGCKFDKHQDDLYTRLEMAYGDYIDVTDDDLWNRLIADWNRRVKE